MLRHLPNTLSASRILLAAVFPFVDARWQPLVIVIAAVTDVADGLIARRFDLTSWAGGLLDGIGDKLFTFAVLVTFAMGGDIWLWQFFVLLSRDWVVAGIAGYAAVTRQWSAFRAMPSGHTTVIDRAPSSWWCRREPGCDDPDAMWAAACSLAGRSSPCSRTSALVVSRPAKSGCSMRWSAR